MALRSISGIIAINENAPQSSAIAGSVTISFLPHEVTSALAAGVTVSEMREAGPDRPFLATPTKNVSLRQFQFNESFFFESGNHTLSIDDTDDEAGATITWRTQRMFVGEISYLFVGDVAEDEIENTGDTSGLTPLEPPNLPPERPGDAERPPIPPPDAGEHKKE